MSIIKFAENAKQFDSDWRQVSSLWGHKKNKGWLVGHIGKQSKDSDGKLQEQFSEITLKVGDVIMVKPNKFYEKGTEQPTHVISVCLGEPKPFKPSKKA
jgi:hypothetical protein